MNIRTSLNSSRIQRFGRNARSLRSVNPLTDSEIRAVAPSIFADRAHSSRSTRYSHIATAEVLTALRKEGFQPYMITQGGSSDETKLDFTKHMLRLRHDSAAGVGTGDTFREIVLVNSHDGTSSYQLMAGMFRMVCSNGMVVGAGDGFDEVKVKHSGDVVPQVIDGCIEILERLPEVSDRVREWSGLALTDGEKGAFARAALELRYDEGEAPFDSARLLTVRRREDAAPTLWNTLNAVQENIIQGGVRYELGTAERKVQRRRTRPVNGIDQNVRLNRALWVLAQEMQRVKGLA